MTDIVTIDKGRQPEEGLAASVGFGDGLLAIDRKLLKLAARGHSGAELEEATGVPAAQAMDRVRKIVASKSWLSTIEREELVLQRLYEFAGTLEDIVDAESRDDVITGYDRYGREQYGRGDPRWMGNLTKIYELILRTLSERMNDVSGVKSEITSNQAKAMGQVIEAGFRDFATSLTKKYPKIKENELREMLEASLGKAFDTLSNKVTVDEEQL